MLKINYVTVYIILMIALTLGAPFFVVFGALSDRIGRRNIMTAGLRAGGDHLLAGVHLAGRPSRTTRSS